jgi:4-hydroxythreonine-4-phosphate dehydrogenase
VLVGDPGAIADAAALRGIDLAALAHVTIEATSALAPAERTPGHPGPPAGRAQLAAIDRALDLVLAGEAEAIVTGPVSKQAIASSGALFTGHTEHLQARTHSPHVVMCFVGPRLRTSLVTTHLAIADLPAAITRAAVTRTVVLTARALVQDFGLVRPRVAVTGLNPHAGEGGMFGTEERDTIAPGIADAVAALGDEADVHGPLAAEAAFRQARDGRWDAVVAMFHDQATIASKLLDFGDAVNVTLGLPIVRTSVDHGTGYDIAGRGCAEAQGMRAALELAFAMAARRAADRPGPC